MIGISLRVSARTDLWLVVAKKLGLVSRIRRCEPDELSRMPLPTVAKRGGKDERAPAAAAGAMPARFGKSGGKPKFFRFSEERWPNKTNANHIGRKSNKTVF